uniref:PPUP9497 n=1 Tax=Poeciliopsis prolifica TaxID=188132 RepID=A0A0S7EQD8_9TELE
MVFSSIYNPKSEQCGMYNKKVARCCITEIISTISCPKGDLSQQREQQALCLVGPWRISSNFLKNAAVLKRLMSVYCSLGKGEKPECLMLSTLIEFLSETCFHS